MVENMLEGLEVRLGSYRYYDMDQGFAPPWARPETGKK